MARYILEELESKKIILNKLIMTGTPNQGTHIAKNKNWNSLFNILINGGALVPVIGKIVTILKFAGNRVLQLPGIDDMELGSKLFDELNNKDFDRSNYYVFISNYEPANLAGNALDQLLDVKIFENYENDTVTTVKSAMFEYSDTVAHLSNDQIELISIEDGINHFGYFKSENIVKKAVELLK